MNKTTGQRSGNDLRMRRYDTRDLGEGFVGEILSLCAFGINSSLLCFFFTYNIPRTREIGRSCTFIAALIFEVGKEGRVMS